MQSTFPRFTVDDAYITFRYAENLALHGELNWNVGENPVEGYTGVALPVILAGFIKLGVSPISASRWIGIFSFWLGWLMLFLIAKKLKLPKVGLGGILILYATTPILFTHSFSGMETMLFAATALSAIYFLISGADNWFLAALLSVGLVRPEGAALAVFFILAAGFVKYRYYPDEFRAFIKSFIFVYFFPALIYFFWRWNYYGQLLPNTFYAKSVAGFQLGVAADIFRFIRFYLALPVLAGLFLWSAETDWLKEKIKKDYWNWRFLAPMAAGLLFCAVVFLVLSRAHLIANFSTRFYVPFLAVLWVGLILIWHLGLSATERLKIEQPARYQFIVFMFIALVSYQALFQIVKLKDEIRFASQQIILQEEEHNLIGKTLKNILPPTESVIVYMDAGAIPYFSKLRAVDFGALNDETLARNKLSSAQRLDYFFSQNPGAVAISSVNAERLDYGAEAQAIVSDPRFKNYVLYKRYIPRDPDIKYYEFVYLRKDLYHK
ncbi:MAG: hypothetical protein Q8Q46_00425 [Candidatus Giovannonibacteria bacterium]|nr:hypothetical protein [Candidatus Giovannonibacteria bacterium]